MSGTLTDVTFHEKIEWKRKNGKCKKDIPPKNDELGNEMAEQSINTGHEQKAKRSVELKERQAAKPIGAVMPKMTG